MQISLQTNQQPVARAKDAPPPVPTLENKTSGEQYIPGCTEDPGLMPKQPQNNRERNYVAEGAAWGLAAGAGVALALGAGTFGVGLVVGVATIPGGLALGLLGGSIAQAIKG